MRQTNITSMNESRNCIPNLDSYNGIRAKLYDSAREIASDDITVS